MPLSIFSCSEEQQKWSGKTMESDLLLASCSVRRETTWIIEHLGN
jgi:hypothetical protein